MSSSGQTFSTEDQLEKWLRAQRPWLQHAAKSALRARGYDADEIVELAKRAWADASGKSMPSPESFPLELLGTRGGGSVVLKSIGRVKGVGKLNPGKPIGFAPDGITVVYGANGSGKSSYVRMLKHICGARLPGKLYPDVFAESSPAPTCTVCFVDHLGETEATWVQENGSITRLATVDIFDTSSGQSYLKDQSPPRYEPRAMRFMSDLAQLAKLVSVQLDTYEGLLKSGLPPLLAIYAPTKAGQWFKQLSAATAPEAINATCHWSEDLEKELEELMAQVAETNPVERAKERRAKKQVIENLRTSLSNHVKWFSDETFTGILNLRRQATEKRAAAQLAAELLKDSKLKGVGSGPWAQLWTHAKSYSVQLAYPGQQFPHVADAAVCVLCQQELGEDGKQRIVAFDKFINDTASKEADQAQRLLDKTLSELPLQQTGEEFAQLVKLVGLPADAADELLAFYVALRQRRQQYPTATAHEELASMPDTAAWLERAAKSVIRLEEQAKQYEVAEQQRQAKNARILELRGQQWLAVNKEDITNEVERRKRWRILETARSYCNPRGITNQASELAKQVVTPVYIEAFNQELKALRAQGISVELKRTGADQGTILHQVRLQGVDDPKLTQEVLSEGEHRVVALAAFMADSAGNPNGSTFIFDDPISSLDSDYEEAVVQRLVQLAQNRQVIVFTHRLSLLGLLKEYAEKEDVGVQVVQLRKQPWGAGEPGSVAIENMEAVKALTKELPVRLASAEQLLQSDGVEAYNIQAQSICSETRKVIERLVEEVLLHNIVIRHRRQIKTGQKLHKLARIELEDCNLIDEMMSKFSRYEHSQSGEAPVPPPLPSELRADIQRMIDWKTKYLARQ